MQKPRFMLTRSCRRHIRAQKALIRKVADPAVRAQKMAELYAKFGLAVPGKEYAG